ncbi:MAG TPA: LPS assembly protein LptD [Terriglobia bacterium]|nr:LPS assembly protein LptD [Terriglobia bacterium]
MTHRQPVCFGWQVNSLTVAPVLVAALLVALAAEGASAQEAEIPPPLQNRFETATVYADSQRESNGVVTLAGHIEVTYRQARLLADRATYNRSSGEIDATGSVAFSDPRAYIEADRAVYNVITDAGTFTNAHGYVHAAERHRSNVPTTSNALFVQAHEIERVNQNTYALSDGRLTSCEDQCRGWSLAVRSARVVADDKAVTYGNVFRFFNIPLFYMPAAKYSVNRSPRQTGFLIPSIGSSTQKGQIIGEGFFWAINPSADVMMGVADYSERGVATTGRFRATPSDTSQLVVNYYEVNDKISGPLRAAGENIRALGVSQNLFDGFRGVIDMDYINSLAFRLTWSNNFNEAVSSEARQTAFLSKSFDDYNMNFYAERYQNFLCAQRTTTSTSETSACNTPEAQSDQVIIRHTPSVSFSGADHELGNSPAYFSFDTSVDGVGRDSPGFSTPLVSDRLDFRPQISVRVPEFWGFHFTPSVGMEATHYGTSLLGPNDPVNRVLGDVSFDLRPPSLERVFDHPVHHYRLKHVIEPDIKYHLVRAENDAQILDVVRFDEKDILAETNEFEYSLKTTLYGRPDLPEDAPNPPQARELVSLSLTQKYYFDPTFGGVLQPGQNVWAPTIDLTGFAFARGQHFSPVVTVLKVAPFSNYDTELRADFDPRGGGLNAGITSGVHRGDVGFEATDFFVSRTAQLGFVAPVPVGSASSLPSSNLFNARVIYGHPDQRGFSGAFGVNYNITEGLANEVVAQGTYNFSCFGIDIGFNRFNLGPLRKENQFRIAISLSNVGAFGNLRSRDRLYQQELTASSQ